MAWWLFVELPLRLIVAIPREVAEWWMDRPSRFQ
jgi:hypothetical protein